VRNIKVDGCERVALRYTVDPVEETPATPYRVDVCMGGDVSFGLSGVATKSPFTDQIPAAGGDTCVYFDNFCGLGDIFDAHQRITVEDENGPPLLPGDTLLYHAQVDLRYMGDPLPPPKEMYLHIWDANVDASDAAIPLPQYIDFVEFVAKPLEPGAIYSYNAGTRMLKIEDPDCPAVSCEAVLPASTGQWNDIVTWRGRLNCAAPNTVAQCMLPAHDHRLELGQRDLDRLGRLGDLHRQQRPDLRTPLAADFSTR